MYLVELLTHTDKTGVLPGEMEIPSHNLPLKQLGLHYVANASANSDYNPRCRVSYRKEVGSLLSKYREEYLTKKTLFRTIMMCAR